MVKANHALSNPAQVDRGQGPIASSLHRRYPGVNQY